ncbi:hypothetical protein KRM28CT15_01950 [Krasilnikovia sp. M28-CT-15]
MDPRERLMATRGPHTLPAHGAVWHGTEPPTTSAPSATEMPSKSMIRQGIRLAGSAVDAGKNHRSERPPPESPILSVTESPMHKASGEVLVSRETRTPDEVRYVSTSARDLGTEMRSVGLVGP